MWPGKEKREMIKKRTTKENMKNDDDKKSKEIMNGKSKKSQ